MRTSDALVDLDPLFSVQTLEPTEQAIFETVLLQGDEAELRSLIRGASPEQAYAWSVLWAAWRGDAPETQRLLGQPRPAGFSCTRALKIAARHGHAGVVALLIPFGDPKSEDSLALRWAAELGHTEVVRTLIPVSDPLADQSFALREAACKGHTDTVALLIPVSDLELAGSEALQFASGRGHLSTVKLLLSVCNPRDRDSAALFDAALNGQETTVDLLLAVSDPLALNSRALMIAAHMGHAGTVQKLAPVSHTADAWDRLIKAESWPGIGLLAPFVPRALWRQALAAAPPDALSPMRAQLLAEDLNASWPVARKSATKPRV